MKTLVPSAPLDRYIEVIWLMPARESGLGAEMALPTATVEFVINIDDDRSAVFDHRDFKRAHTFDGPLVCGAHSEPFAIDTRHRGKTLGVHFKPGGAAAFLPLPIHVLENTHVALAELIGEKARRLRDDLDAVSYDDASLLKTMAAFLAGCFTENVHPAIAFALEHLNDNTLGPSVKDLVDATGYSHRRFNELFRKTTGLSAKRFSRVVRFQHAIHLIEASPYVDWSDLVAACGFYDQAHLIHEFRRHARLTPRAYLGQRGDRLNHPLLP